MAAAAAVRFLGRCKKKFLNDEKFTRVTALPAPVATRPTVTPDQIIPARFREYPRSEGYGQHLFPTCAKRAASSSTTAYDKADGRENFGHRLLARRAAYAFQRTLGLPRADRAGLANLLQQLHEERDRSGAAACLSLFFA